MRTLAIALLAFTLFLPTANAQTLKGQFDVLNGLPKMHSKDKVVFEEFLNFGCPHCNNFHNASAKLRETFKDRVEFVNIPILFRGQGDSPLRLYYIGEKMGKGEEVKAALFKAKFKHSVDVFDPGIINYLSRSLGLGEEYAKQKDEPWLTAKIADNATLANSYGVTATPTIVIEKTLKMKGAHSMEELVASMDKTLNDLLKK